MTLDYQTYTRLKQDDYLQFFRTGDFYEAFEEDAKIVSQELEIVLASRKFEAGVRLVMVGIPDFATEQGFRDLINRGYKIKVYEEKR